MDLNLLKKINRLILTSLGYQRLFTLPHTHSHTLFISLAFFFCLPIPIHTSFNYKILLFFALPYISIYLHFYMHFVYRLHLLLSSSFLFFFLTRLYLPLSCPMYHQRFRHSTLIYSKFVLIFLFHLCVSAPRRSFFRPRRCSWVTGSKIALS